MTKTESSLLLYLETCAVDRAGRINTLRLNAADMAILDVWNQSGFVQSGRVVSGCITGHGESMWCHLSDAAFTSAATERRARADRLWKNRNYERTEDRLARGEEA